MTPLTNIAIIWSQAEVSRMLTKNDMIVLVDDKTLVHGTDVGSEKHNIRAFDDRGNNESRNLSP